MMSQDGPQSRAALATANRRSALLRFRRKREARTFDKKVSASGSHMAMQSVTCSCNAASRREDRPMPCDSDSKDYSHAHCRSMAHHVCL